MYYPIVKLQVYPYCTHVRYLRVYTSKCSCSLRPITYKTPDCQQNEAISSSATRVMTTSTGARYWRRRTPSKYHLSSLRCLQRLSWIPPYEYLRVGCTATTSHCAKVASRTAWWTWLAAFRSTTRCTSWSRTRTRTRGGACTRRCTRRSRLTRSSPCRSARESRAMCARSRRSASSSAAPTWCFLRRCACVPGARYSTSYYARSFLINQKAHVRLHVWHERSELIYLFI